MPTQDHSDQHTAAALRTLFRVMRRFRQHVPTRSLTAFEAFLTVANRNPSTISEVAAALGSSLTVTKAALDTLGGGAPRLVPSSPGRLPPRLVDYVDNPIDARSTLAGLTPKGVELALEMRAALAAMK